MKRLIIFFICLCPVIANAQLEEKYKKAIAMYDYETPIGEIPPMSGDTVLVPLRAKALKAMNRHSEVLKEWNSLLSPDSTNVEVLAELAEGYRIVNKYNQASRCYQKLLNLCPDNKFVRQQYLRVLLTSENFKSALDAAHDWLKRDSVSSIGYKYLGEAYEGLAVENPMMLISAFSAYNSAYRRDSLDAQIVAHIAALFNNNEQYAEAVNVTETYRKTDKDNIDVNRQNAKAYGMMKNYDKAIERYEELKSAGDRSFTTLYYCGISYYGKEWFHPAEENLLLAHKKRPTDIDLIYYLAKACSYTSSQEKGVQLMKEAIRLSERSDTTLVRLYEGLVECYNRWYKGDPYEKIEIMKKTYTLNKKHPLFYKIAEVYNQQKDYENAIYYYEKYMKMVPENKRMALDEEGKPKLGWTSLYQIAERKIEKIKEESFFRDGLKK